MTGEPQGYRTPDHFAPDQFAPDHKGRIVVGVDGSPGSKAALAWAAGQARMQGCPLEAIITWDPVATPWTPYPLDLINDLRIENDKHGPFRAAGWPRIRHSPSVGAGGRARLAAAFCTFVGVAAADRGGLRFRVGHAARGEGEQPAPSAVRSGRRAARRAGWPSRS